jgi:hypothetical protein
MASDKKESRTRALAAKVIFAALSSLKEAGKGMPIKELIKVVGDKVNLNEWEEEIYPKSKNPRWVHAIYFFSIDCIKAGYLLKEKGICTITEEGEKALQLGPKGLLDEASRRYKEWELVNKKSKPEKKLPKDNSINVTIRGQQFTFTTENVIQAFSETSEADWRNNPGIEAYYHVVVGDESKPIKSVFRKLSSVPDGFRFNTHEAERAFKALGFVTKDMRIANPKQQLSLIGTWKEVVDEHVSVEEAIEQRGGWASWWSFPIEETAQNLLTTPFHIYLNSGSGVLPFRMKVEEYQTSRGNEGIPSPWPGLTDENCKNVTRAGERQSEIFKTWLKVSEIEKLDPPLTLDDMNLAESLSNPGNVLNQNRFGYVYLNDAGLLTPGKEKEFTNQPEYSLATCVEETGLDLATLERWVRAIERKRQAVLYGPPGTGKTYVAERLAKHLVGNGNGFIELVQFHPTYSYEDFIQGIRPKARKDGGLDFLLVPGRFLEFCEKATHRSGPCVLILDEINRANLSRVFGELMYLLEYRDKEIPLSGGERFAIPSNVRLIGTMNTADRSIALVDHALRRRFAFLELYPNYDVLEKYHAVNGFSATGLVETLKRVNKQIGDHHYMVGISFFLRRDIKAQIEDIWQMEIEPYLEEYFFDQSSKVDELRWAKVKNMVLGE